MNTEKEKILDKDEIIDHLYRCLKRRNIIFDREKNEYNKLHLYYIKENDKLNQKEISIDFETFKKYINSQEEKDHISNNLYLTDSNLEILTIDEDHKDPFWSRNVSSKLETKNNKLNYKYEYGPISLCFILKIIENIKDRRFQENIIRRISSVRHILRLKNSDKISEEEILKKYFADVLTSRFNFVLRLIPKDPNHNLDFKNIKEYCRLVESYLFNLNLAGIKVKLCKDFNTYLSIKNIRQVHKKINIPSKEPYKTYDKGLLDLYSVATCSDEPFTKYICYYQILEHFFTEIPNNELIHMVQNELTNPQFIFTDRDKILNLVRKIREKARSNDAEKMSLKLVLMHFVEDISVIENKLEDYDNNVEYLKNEVPSFLKEVSKRKISIDFSNENSDVLGKMATRIYTVRNALVHNKENTKNNYDPLNNSADLRKELPLIRSIAEIVIIKSGKKIELSNF